MIDYHIHTSISGDCATPMKDMAQAAYEKGLREICFTEHIDFDFPCDIDFSVDFDAYRQAFEAVKDALPDITMRRGIEAGLDVRCKDMAEIIEAQDFDFVIGSVHLVFGQDPYGPDVWQRYTQREIFEEYLRVSIERAAKCGFFDVFGHIGYVSKFCPADDKRMRYGDYTDAIDTLLKSLVEQGKGIEVNTSGLLMTGSTMPETAIIARYRELGGEIITVGSDAHTETAVGYAIPETLAILGRIGFKYVCTFDKRVPQFLPIP